MLDRSVVQGRDFTWRQLVDLLIGAAMMLLAFVGIAASDVSGAGSQAYWSALAVAFGFACYAILWLNAGPEFRPGREAIRVAAHWMGVFAAVELVYFFIASGRFANADAGLLNGLILALATFLAGVHASWRIAAVGAALGLGTVFVAYLEQYLWVLFALALVVLAGIYLVSRLRRRAGARAV